VSLGSERPAHGAGELARDKNSQWAVNDRHGYLSK
jgi:hypothetical protein